MLKQVELASFQLEGTPQGKYGIAKSLESPSEKWAVKVIQVGGTQQLEEMVEQLNTTYWIKSAYLVKCAQYAFTKSNNSIQIYFFHPVHQQDLKQQLLLRSQANSRFVKKELQTIIKAIYKGCENLHEIKVYHKNIKLTNILKVEDSYRLTDIGLSTGPTPTTLSEYPPEYVQTQQNVYQRQQVDFSKCDVYQVGLIMLQVASIQLASAFKYLSSRRNPEFLKHFQQAIEDIRRNYGYTLSEIIVNSLKEDPQRRSSMAQFRSMVQTFCQEDSHSDALPVQPEQSQPNPISSSQVYNNNSFMPVENNSAVQKLYRQIRKTFNTLVKFYANFDKNDDKQFDRKEFLSILREMDLDIGHEQGIELYKRLDPLSKGIIYFTEFDKMFQEEVDKELKGMVINVKEQVQNSGRNMFELEGSQVEFMKIIGLMDIVRQVCPGMTIKEVDFLVTYLHVQKDIQQQYSYPDLVDKVTNNLRLHSVDFNKDLFTKPARPQISMQQSTGHDPVLVRKIEAFKTKLDQYSSHQIKQSFQLCDKNSNRSLGFGEFQEMSKMVDPSLDWQTQRSIFDQLAINNSVTESTLLQLVSRSTTEKSPTQDIQQMIAQRLKEQQVTPEQHFYSFDSTMSEVDFKIRVSELNINLHSANMAPLMARILNPQNSQVDLTLFFQLLQTPQHNNRTLPMDLVAPLAAALVAARQGSNLLGVQDLTPSQLGNLLTYNNLSVDFHSVREQQSPLDIQQVRQQVETHIQYLTLVQKLRNLVHVKGISFNQLFRTIDTDFNGVFSQQEFNRFLFTLESSISQEMCVYFFNYLDKDKNGSISAKEFVKLFDQDSSKEEPSLKQDQHLADMLSTKNMSNNMTHSVALNNHMSLSTQQNSSQEAQMPSYLFPYVQQVVMSMKQSQKTFAIFRQADFMETGLISASDFQQILFTQLQLSSCEEQKGLVNYLQQVSQDPSQLIQLQVIQSTLQSQAMNPQAMNPQGMNPQGMNKQFPGEKMSNVEEKREYLKRLQSYLWEERISLKTLFRKMDLEDMKYLSLALFSRFNNKYLEYGHSQNEMYFQDLFNIIDLDENRQISLKDLSTFVMSNQENNVIQLNKTIRKRLLSQDTNIDNIFDSFDRDGNGIIEYQEFFSALQSHKLGLNAFQIIQLFEHFDGEGNERIKYKEFQQMLSVDNIQIERLRNKVDLYLNKNGLQLKQLYNVLDNDDSGKISRKEFKRMMGLVNYQFIQGRVEDEEVQELFEQSDKNHMHQLSYSEFYEILHEDKDQDLQKIADKINAQNKKDSMEIKQFYLAYCKDGMNRLNRETFFKLLRGFYEIQHSQVDLVFNKLQKDQYVGYQDFEIFLSHNVQGGFQQEQQGSGLFPSQASPQMNVNSLFQTQAPLMGNGATNLPPQEDWKNESTPFFNRLQQYMFSHPDFAFFDLLTQYDTNLNCKISDISTVRLIMNQIPGLSVSEQDLNTFYSNWKDETSQLNFIQLILQIQSPEFILQQCLKYILKTWKKTVAQLFSAVDKDNSGLWCLNEFQLLNSVLTLKLSYAQVNKLFEEWSKDERMGGQPSPINIQRLEIILDRNLKVGGQESQGGFLNGNMAATPSTINNGFNQQSPMATQQMNQQQYMSLRQREPIYLKQRLGPVQGILRDTQQKVQQRQVNLAQALPAVVTKQQFLDSLQGLQIQMQSLSLLADTLISASDGLDVNEWNEIMSGRVNNQLAQKYGSQSSVIQSVQQKIRQFNLNTNQILNNTQSKQQLVQYLQVNNLQVNNPEFNALIDKLSLNKIDTQDLIYILNNLSLIFNSTSNNINTNMNQQNNNMNQQNGAQQPQESVLDKCIKQIFSKSDVDKNGTLDPNEIMMALKYLGLNLKNEDIEQELSQVDKDGDGLIDQQEFRVIATRMIEKEVLRTDRLIQNLRHLCPTGRMSPSELFNMLKHLVQLDPQSIQAIQSVVFPGGLQQTGLSSFTRLLVKDTASLEESLQGIMLDIKQQYNISVQQLIDLFSQLPEHYVMSFTRQLIRDGRNTWDDTVQSLLRKAPGMQQLTNVLSDCNGVCIEVSGKGLKIQTAYQGEQQRVMRVCLLHKESQQVVGMVGTLLLNKEFVSTDTLIVKVPLAHHQLQLLVEVVIQIMSNRKIIDVSVGYARFEMAQLVKLSSGKTQTVGLQGGNPRRNIKMQQQVKKSFWGGNRTETSQMTITVQQSNKSTPAIQKNFGLLWNHTVVNKSMVGLASNLGEFLQVRMQQVGSVARLGQDTMVMTIVRTLDNPSTRQAVGDIWNRSIAKMSRPDQVKAMNSLSEMLYWVYSDLQFNLDSLDPTQHRWFDQEQQRVRQMVMGKVEEQLLIRLKVKQGQSQHVVDPRQAKTFFPFENTVQDDEHSLEQLQRFFHNI